MEWQISSYSDLELTEVANQIKEILLLGLEKEGLIKNSANISANYAIVVAKKNLLGRAVDLITGRKPEDDNLSRLILVKIVAPTLGDFKEPQKEKNERTNKN